MNIRKLAQIVIVITCSGLLQSCMNAAMSGAQAFYGRHNLKNTFNDNYIALKSERTLYLDSKHFKDTHVSVTSFNGVVLIAGQVKTPSQKTEVGEIVKNIADSNEIHNLVEISPPSSALVRASDSWITTKVKAKLIAQDDVDPSQIKVLTENGVVYLMGILPHDQAYSAVEAARSTAGVLSVVKVFSYITISKV